MSLHFTWQNGKDIKDKYIRNDQVMQVEERRAPYYLDGSSAYLFMRHTEACSFSH